MKTSMLKGTTGLLGDQLFECAPIGLAVTADETSFVRVNSAFCRFLGYSKQELLGKTVRDVTDPDDWATSVELIRRFRSTKKPTKPFEKRYRHKSGKVVWGEVSMFVIGDGRHKAHCTMAQIVDITERKNQEDALRVCNERFRVALAGSPTVVFSQDRELRYTWIHNPSPCFKIENVLGKRESDVVNTHDAKGLMRIKRMVMKTGARHRGEITLHLPIGETVFDVTIEPLRDEQGKIIGITCAAVDITERKRLETSLQKANEQLEQKVKERTARLRQLTDQLTKAAHDERRRIADILHEQLQQHLCGMKFRAYHLKEGCSTPAMIDSADRLVNEFDDAIRMTRILTTDLHPPVLSHLGVRDAIEWLATDVKEKMGLSVTVRIDKRVPVISGELKMFAFEAARELLLNVVKHAKVKTAELRLGSMAKGRVRIQVKDTGVGFNPEQSNEDGSHFGLFRIQERAESFGGCFEVVSQPSKGTSVSIILPRTSTRP
ncbi:MAG: PAS domain S-box protein [bacterium]